jgi:NAD(P)H-nitrite reductase large subunit
MRHVVIGNGISGISAVETIRNIDPQARITLIAGESFAPYSRPMISMVLEGSVRADRLPLRPETFYESLQIEAAVGEWVRKIDTENRLVETDRGNRFPYDRLLIATGADPRPLKVPGAGLPNVFFMRTQAHVQGMLDAINAGARNTLVLGGGLVGLKATYGLLRRGLNVKLLIRSDYPLSMQVDEFAGKILLQELVDRGLEVRVGAEPAAFEGNGKVREAVLTDGTRHQCDLAVIGKGVNPAVSFLPRDKIKVDLGIVVDEHLETSLPGVFAAGDVAEHFDIARKTRWVNAIWPVAVEQGRIAGMNMAGRKVCYPGSLGRNVIRIFGTDVLTAGLVNPPANGDFETISSCDRHAKTYRKLVFQGDRLVGLVMVNCVEQGGVLMSLIHNEIPIRIGAHRERLIAPSFNYSQLLLK